MARVTRVVRPVWDVLGSLRLTVVCLAVSIVVIFIGTVAQADEGLYEAQARYFKQWLVWAPMLLGHRLPLLLPGGYLLGTLLVLNLVVAHIRRFSWSVRKAGLHLAHVGIVVLLAGQLVTDMLSVETQLRLREGEAKNYTEKPGTHELVLVREPGNEEREEISFPETLVARGGEIAHEGLPFELRVRNYHVNSEIFSRAAVLEAGARISGALAAVESRFATREDLLLQAERVAQNPGRLKVWREALAALGETDVDDLAATVRRLDFDQQERMRRHLRGSFQDAMLTAFLQRGGAAQVAAERLARHEPVSADALPLAGDRGDALKALVIPAAKTKELNAVNLPYASIEVIQAGESLGTWLLSPWLDRQSVVVEGTTWYAAFRPARVNVPFEVKLLESTHEVYLGTDIPRNFQSRIQINHPAKGETRKVDISMNEPLRYEGLTFFQYQMGQEELNDSAGTSTLLVVRNPAWLTPYVGCLMVALGLGCHFLLHLVAFVGRRRPPKAVEETGRARLPSMKRDPAPAEAVGGIFSGLRGGARARCAPFFVAGLSVLWLMGGWHKSKLNEGEFAVEEFGGLPIVSNGRVQPWDSLARNSLLQLRERQTLKLESERLSATEWLLAMMMKQDLADTWPVFRIDHPDLKSLLRETGASGAEQEAGGNHFSWLSIRANLKDVQREARRAGNVDPALRSSYDQAIIKLWGGVGLYMRLQNTLHPQNAENWEAELENFASNAPGGIAALRQREEGRPHNAAALERTERDLQRFDIMAQLDLPLIVPVLSVEGDSSGENWMSTVDGIVQVAREESFPAGLNAYARMASSYRRGEAGSFNEALAGFGAALQANFQPELRKASREHLFNRLAPFYKALVLYGVAFLGAAGFWLAPQRLGWLRRAAAWVVLAAFAVHTAGLLFRMGIEGRPPVTNLYSSAIFVGWGACLLGLILERFWRNSMGIIVSSTLGFLTLIVAHHLSLAGDTMEMMRAVLDTNFWLATHVVVITLGYSSMFVAGLLGAVYVVLNGCTRAPDADISKSLCKMAFGVICFATLFSFVGTLLGGIWADQSWGRFWGWDPKENGALMIVLWNALVLHARWGGMIRDRGLMSLAILGNIVTAWSWFGVNMLGIGLHSYGFTNAGFPWLALFAGSQLLLVAFGLAAPGFRRLMALSRNDSADTRARGPGG